MNLDANNYILNEEDYIYPLKIEDRYNVEIDKKMFPILAKFQGNIDTQNCQLVLAKACIEGGNGAKYYSNIRNYLSIQKSETAYIIEYNQLQQTLQQMMIGETKELQAELEAFNRYINTTVYGLIYKGVRVVSIDSNVFADYLLKRVKVVVQQNEDVGIYNLKGRYDLKGEFILWRIATRLLDEVEVNIWKPTWNSSIIASIKTKCKLITEFNAEKHLLNVGNGVIDLNRFILQKHTHRIYSTMQITWFYDKESDCPLFKKFINETMREDEELIDFIQEMMGYCLTTETKAEKMFFFYGSGSNGKSVLANIITKLIGAEYVANTSLSELNGSFGLSTILNKLVCISGENEVDTPLNTERLKQIVSGDRINVNIKCKQQIDYRPVCKIIALTNNMPQVSDESMGFFRKISVVPFLNSVPPEKQDKDLIYKLEKELPGILRWSLDGLKRLKSNNYNFTPSKAIENTMNHYKAQQKPMNEFIKDCIVERRGHRVMQKKIREAFDEWCYQNCNNEARSKYNKTFWKPFQDALAELGIRGVKWKSNGVEYFKDIDIVKVLEREGREVTQTGVIFTL